MIRLTSAVILLASCSPLGSGGPPATTTVVSAGSEDDAEAASSPASESPDPSQASTSQVFTNKEPTPSTNQRRGSITYVSGKTVYRLDVRAGARPEDLSGRLDKGAPGEDDFVGVSRNGKFITLSTTRFLKECAGWACLTLLNEDFTMTASVLVKGRPIHPSGRAAVSDDGKLIVYASSEGPHEQDLFVLRKSQKLKWQKPKLLTEGSAHKFNTSPVLSPDGTRVLFDCGPVPYSQAGTGICEVDVEGVSLSLLVNPDKGPLASEGDFLACHGDYLADGSIVFEADWSGEQLWRLKDGSTPRRLNPAFSNDNAPCVLPGGYVASLWLERPSSSGVSEIKIMQSDGTEFDVLMPTVGVSQINCHATPSAQ